ncbi:RapZ family nucleotide-binding protein [Veillonella parvula]|uniref:RapZ family nucleotide-binding protein n=1 Tax=Veillonella parvula TaxID=29466 RepID=UPI0028FF13E8|nr:RapZ family nucleotide-binding protein [Veillonella parvula]MDU1046313.1 RapZ family nucleotide-binding protein [Veillonella parvula]
MEAFRLLIVTGMSGAGKTQVLQALEDMGYLCIDNIPPVLIPKLSEICRQGGERTNRVALVVDIRGGEFFEALSSSLDTLKDMKVDFEIVFMDATDETLIRRYKESRRSHPLAPNGLITTGLKKERQILNSVRHKADFIIDTTNMKTASLKEYFFGFKYGIPLDADMVWDVRFLPNPFYIPEFRHKTGRVKAVNEYIHSFEVTEEFKRRYFDTMDFLVPNYEQEGKSQFIVAVGCTGGMHRSVAMAEALYSHLLEKGYRVTVEHRDMMKNNVEEDYNPHEIITLDN